MTSGLPTENANCTRVSPGFSLVEIVVVMLILGIMAAVAAPKFASALHQYRAEAAATRIKADLGLVRQHAIATSSQQKVQFSVATNGYNMPGLPDLNHAGQAYAVDLAVYPYHAELESTSLGGDSLLQFDRYGKPDGGGTITVRSGEYQRTVTIDPETGKATTS
jgi:prepilin-type N-terminal cleavage/methylation domain-containing protein